MRYLIVLLLFFLYGCASTKKSTQELTTLQSKALSLAKEEVGFREKRKLNARVLTQRMDRSGLSIADFWLFSDVNVLNNVDNPLGFRSGLKNFCHAASGDLYSLDISRGLKVSTAYLEYFGRMALLERDESLFIYECTLGSRQVFSVALSAFGASDISTDKSASRVRIVTFENDKKIDALKFRGEYLFHLKRIHEGWVKNNKNNF